MNSRERVLLALNHREPDRVPFDLGGTVVTGIHHKAYVAWRQALGLPAREPKIIDMIQQLAQVDDDMLDRLGVDMRNISPRSSASFQITIGDMGEYTYFYDEFGTGWRSPKDGGWYYDMFDYPLKGEMTVEQVESYPLPDPLDPLFGLRSLQAGKIGDTGLVPMPGTSIERQTGGSKRLFLASIVPGVGQLQTVGRSRRSGDLQSR